MKNILADYPCATGAPRQKNIRAERAQYDAHATCRANFFFGERAKNKSRASRENSLASRGSVATVPPRQFTFGRLIHAAS